jgi:putative MATE family efflux protein
MKHVLDTDNISKILLKMSLPAIIGMVFMALYNIVDTIFVGKGVGALGIAGIAIVFPIQMITMSVGQMLGIGGASLVSRSLGNKNIKKANITLGNVIITILFLSAPITILGTIYIDKLLLLFGSTATIIPYAKAYMGIVILAAPLVGISMALNNMLRADGKAKIAMFTMIIGGLTNVVLDAIFIFGFKMGIQGAAWATFISHIVTSSFLFYYILARKSSLTIKLKYLRPNINIQKEILGIGIAVFIRQAAGSILIAVMNKTLSVYGGDLAIAAFGILFRLVMLTTTPMIGIAQGVQPVAGFNFGAKKYGKTKEAIKIATIWATIAGCIGFIVLFTFARLFMSAFTNDIQVIKIGTDALRIIILAIPIVGFQIIGSSIFQALGKILPAFVLSLSRQVLFLIPLVLILPHYYHLSGIWGAFPIADILSAILTFLMLRPLWKKLSINKNNNL